MGSETGLMMPRVSLEMLRVQVFVPTTSVRRSKGFFSSISVRSEISLVSWILLGRRRIPAYGSRNLQTHARTYVRILVYLSGPHPTSI